MTNTEVLRFRVSRRDGHYHYFVSVPPFNGDEVVDARAFDAVVSELDKVVDECGHWRATAEEFAGRPLEDWK